MLNNILSKCEFLDISANKIIKNNWFIGSALMAHNYKTLDKGIFYYEQNTIWTKILNLNRINSYWEIHNNTENILTIDQSFEKNIAILKRLLENIKNIEYIKYKDIFIVMNEKCIAKEIDDLVNIVKYNMPFYIEGEKVGNYLKIFIKKDNKYFPYIDCTLFDLNKRQYFEINRNLYYKEIIDYITYKKIPKKIKKYMKILKEINFRREMIENYDYIRLFSLLDCVFYLDEHNCQISSTYVGHLTKKILKECCLATLILNYDISCFKNKLSKSYYLFLNKEYEKIKTYYPILINKYSKNILKERYGINERLLSYLISDNNKCKNVDNDIKYFTDIALSNIDNDEDFKNAIEKIIKEKII